MILVSYDKTGALRIIIFLIGQRTFRGVRLEQNPEIAEFVELLRRHQRDDSGETDERSRRRDADSLERTRR